MYNGEGKPPRDYYKTNKVDYVGLSCDCIGLTNADPCNHSAMLNDYGFINHVLNLLDNESV